ncbi:Ferrous iron transport protein B, FeoB [Methyloversatilis universalis FAM5]|uniref:Fe(2+) transporter FeoB n=1 Tax=Methyloversatilis universalis (strain ATCC BAA-1314 / DSM 25237 / JCM 13912 / CCUG 52030 / FAM5) TaxID=1000565 RepID=F5RAU3_METUF|nr:ferrous iron transporter B [Methyloversatilis universalis]EGK72314.1 Ferrous iron transport protein B, FeoB [Methyloversatilis universalis FAM5]
MSTVTVDTSRLGPPLVALVGNPNCGKTALFNLLTGSRQKVANYAGVTVERKEGRLQLPSGRRVALLDLPGTYSLAPHSPDEQVTCDVLAGRFDGERRPDLVLAVVDATRLARQLRLVLGLMRMGLPVVVALNMTDLARARGHVVDADALSAALGVPVVSTVAVRADGARALLERLDLPAPAPVAAGTRGGDALADDHRRVRDILRQLGLDSLQAHAFSDRADRVLLHPVAGPVLLLALLFVVFQAVFAWAEAPMGWIESATAAAGDALGALLPPGLLRSLLVDGLVAGLGGVLVFLPQIVILFFFILVLEESGYLPRAAFLLDRLMGGVGLSGRSFIPLLSSFACAIPGIMATRTIQNPRDRWVTIMIAPLMTCSARLPVYALLIGAFVPARSVAGGLELQGLVLFALYAAGIVSAIAVAWLVKRFGTRDRRQTLMMELPDYHWPSLRNVAIGLWQRVLIFLRRVGGVILALTVLLWFLASFPAPPAGATGPAIEYSFAGMLGHLLLPLFEPLGFNWQIAVALVPGMAAREVVVSALGTVYALSATADDTAQALAPLIAAQWSLPTALSLLAWFVFAPQCLSTLATVRRETGGWRAPLLMAGYLFGLAWLAAFITYRIAQACCP